MLLNANTFLVTSHSTWKCEAQQMKKLGKSWKQGLFILTPSLRPTFICIPRVWHFCHEIWHALVIEIGLLYIRLLPMKQISPLHWCGAYYNVVIQYWTHHKTLFSITRLYAHIKNVFHLTFLLPWHCLWFFLLSYCVIFARIVIINVVMTLIPYSFFSMYIVKYFFSNNFP